jgi:hypothetical protein
MRSGPLLAITTILLVLAGVTPAHAEASAVQDRIDQVLVDYGGTQSSWNQVSWDGGAIVLTVVDPTGPQTFSIGPCAAGKYCAYSGTSYTGSVLTFSTCTTGNSVAALGQVRSIANSRTSGTVRAYNGSTLVATVSANTGKTPISGTVSTVSCSS